jgi:hypothetical protein
MAAKCFQAVLNDSGVTAETSSSSGGAVLYLVAALGAALAADSSDDVLSNPHAELKRRIIASAGGKRSLAYQEHLERLLTSLEMRAATR